MLDILLTYSKYMDLIFFFYVSWLLLIKQQSSEPATEIRIQWINTRQNKMMYFWHCLFKMIFSELDKIIHNTIDKINNR